MVGLHDHEADAVGAGVFLVADGGVVLDEAGGDGRHDIGEEGAVLEGVDPGLGGELLVVGDDAADVGLGRHAVVVALGCGEIEDEIVVGDP